MEKLLNKLHMMLLEHRFNSETVKLPVRIGIGDETQYRVMYVSRRDYQKMRKYAGEDLIAKLK